MEENFRIKDIGAIQSTKYPGRWDVEGDVDLSYKRLTKLPLKFGIVSGHFDCHGNKLTNLEGSPIEVGGNFDCSTNNLTSLEGAPQKVSGSFNYHTNYLITLKHLPTYIGLLYLDGSCSSLEHLNDLLNVELKEGIRFSAHMLDVYRVIQVLRNTNLDTLEYIIDNHKFDFIFSDTKKYFYMNLEQIVVKKRLEIDLYLINLITKFEDD